MAGKAAAAQEKLRGSSRTYVALGGDDGAIIRGFQRGGFGDGRPPRRALKQAAWQSGAETQGVALARLEAACGRRRQQICAARRKGVSGCANAGRRASIESMGPQAARTMGNK